MIYIHSLHGNTLENIYFWKDLKRSIFQKNTKTPFHWLLSHSSITMNSDLINHSVDMKKLIIYILGWATFFDKRIHCNIVILILLIIQANELEELFTYLFYFISRTQSVNSTEDIDLELIMCFLYAFQGFRSTFNCVL